MIRIRPLLTTAAMVGISIGLLFGLRGPLGNVTANHWRQKLNNATDEQVEPLLRQATALGDSGIVVLVESLGSRRESVARAARGLLDTLLDDWQENRHRGDSPKLGVLARELSDRIDDFGPTARGEAADLATRILLWPPDAGEVDRTELIAACEKVLRTVSHDEEPLGRPTSIALSAEAESELVERPDLTAEDGVTTVDIERLASLPGGGLPVGGFDLPNLLPRSAGQSPVFKGVKDDVDLDADSSEPSVATDESTERPPRLLDVPEGEAGKPLKEAPPGPLSSPSQLEPPRPDSLRSTSLEGDREKAEQPSGLESVDPLNLIHQLRSTDPSLAEQAREELSLRGFATVHFELARRLTHPDPRIRVELARRLPVMRSVDPTTWLLWLSRDEDADVRFAAIGLLATTADPLTQAKIERIAAADSDPRIRRQGEQLAPKRR